MNEQPKVPSEVLCFVTCSAIRPKDRERAPQTRSERQQYHSQRSSVMAEKEVAAGGAASAMQAVLQQSDKLPSDTPQIRGYDFNQGVDYDKLLGSLLQTGAMAPVMTSIEFAQNLSSELIKIACRVSSDQLWAGSGGGEQDVAMAAIGRVRL